jgi:hypothetical protein
VEREGEVPPEPHEPLTISPSSLLPRHTTAFLCAFSTGFCTLLAMLMFVGIALFGTPIANFRANLAHITDIFAVSCHQSHTQFANVSTIDTTFWAIVVALLAMHFGEAILTINNALLTGFDTALEFSIHFRYSLVD